MADPTGNAGGPRAAPVPGIPQYGRRHAHAATYVLCALHRSRSGIVAPEGPRRDLQACAPPRCRARKWDERGTSRDPRPARSCASPLRSERHVCGVQGILRYLRRSVGTRLSGTMAVPFASPRRGADRERRGTRPRCGEPAVPSPSPWSGADQRPAGAGGLPEPGRPSTSITAFCLLFFALKPFHSLYGCAGSPDRAGIVRYRYGTGAAVPARDARGTVVGTSGTKWGRGVPRWGNWVP
jgi:hypothetical protein